MLTANENAKRCMLAILQGEPDDSSYDDLLRELAFHRVVVRGLESLAERRLTTDEIRQRMKSWHG